MRCPKSKGNVYSRHQKINKFVVYANTCLKQSNALSMWMNQRNKIKIKRKKHNDLYGKEVDIYGNSYDW